MSTASCANVGSPYGRQTLNKHLPKTYNHMLSREEECMRLRLQRILTNAVGMPSIITGNSHDFRSGIVLLDHETEAQASVLPNEIHFRPVSAVLKQIDTFNRLKYNFPPQELRTIIEQLLIVSFCPGVPMDLQTNCWLIVQILLHKKRKSPDLIRLAWQPLYEILSSEYMSHVHPDSRGASKVMCTRREHLISLISTARRFFPVTSTTEIVSKFHGLATVSSSHTLIFLYMFLPYQARIEHLPQKLKTLESWMNSCVSCENNPDKSALWIAILTQFAKQLHVGDPAEPVWRLHIPLFCNQLFRLLYVSDPLSKHVRESPRKIEGHAQLFLPESIKPRTLDGLSRLLIKLIHRCKPVEIKLDTSQEGVSNELASSKIQIILSTSVRSQTASSCLGIVEFFERLFDVVGPALDPSASVGSAGRVLSMAVSVTRYLSARMGQEAASRQYSLSQDEKFTTCNQETHINSQDVTRLLNAIIPHVNEAIFARNPATSFAAARCLKNCATIAPQRIAAVVDAAVERGLIDPDAVHQPSLAIGALGVTAACLSPMLWPRPHIASSLPKILEAAMNSLDPSDAVKSQFALLVISRIFGNVHLASEAADKEAQHVDCTTLIENLGSMHPDRTKLHLKRGDQHITGMETGDIPYVVPYDELIDNVQNVSHCQPLQPCLQSADDGNAGQYETNLIDLYSTAWRHGSPAAENSLTEISIPLLEKLLHILTIAEGTGLKGTTSSSDRKSVVNVKLPSPELTTTMAEYGTMLFTFAPFSGGGIHPQAAFAETVLHTLEAMFLSSDDHLRREYTRRIVDWALSQSPSEAKKPVAKVLAIISRSCGLVDVGKAIEAITSKVRDIIPRGHGIQGMDLNTGALHTLEWRMWLLAYIVTGNREAICKFQTSLMEILDQTILASDHAIRDASAKLLRHMLRCLLATRLSPDHKMHSENLQNCWARWGEPALLAVIEPQWLTPSSTHASVALNVLCRYLAPACRILRGTLLSYVNEANDAIKPLLSVSDHLEGRLNLLPEERTLLEYCALSDVRESRTNQQVKLTSKSLYALLKIWHAAIRGISFVAPESLQSSGDDEVLAHSSAMDPIENDDMNKLLNLVASMSPVASDSLRTAVQSTSLSIHPFAGMRFASEWLCYCTMVVCNTCPLVRNDPRPLKQTLRIVRSLMTTRGVKQEEVQTFVDTLRVAKSSGHNALFRAYCKQLAEHTRTGRDSNRDIVSARLMRPNSWFGRRFAVRRIAAWNAYRLHLATTVISRVSHWQVDEHVDPRLHGSLLSESCEKVLPAVKTRLSKIFNDSMYESFFEHALLQQLSVGEQNRESAYDYLNMIKCFIVMEVTMLHQHQLEAVNAKVLGSLVNMLDSMPFLKCSVVDFCLSSIQLTTKSLQDARDQNNQLTHPIFGFICDDATAWSVARGSLTALTDYDLFISKASTDITYFKKLVDLVVMSDELATCSPADRVEQTISAVTHVLIKFSQFWQKFVASSDDIWDIVSQLRWYLEASAGNDKTDTIVSKKHWRHQLSASMLLLVTLHPQRLSQYNNEMTITSLAVTPAGEREDLREWIWNWWITLGTSDVPPLRALGLRSLSNLLYLAAFGEMDIHMYEVPKWRNLDKKHALPKNVAARFCEPAFLETLSDAVSRAHPSANQSASSGKRSADSLWSFGVAEAVNLVEYMSKSWGTSRSSEYQPEFTCLWYSVIHAIGREAVAPSLCAVLPIVAQKSLSSANENGVQSAEEERRAYSASAVEIANGLLFDCGDELAEEFAAGTVSSTNSNLSDVLENALKSLRCVESPLPHEWSESDVEKISNNMYKCGQAVSRTLKETNFGQVKLSTPLLRSAAVVKSLISLYENIPFDWIHDFHTAFTACSHRYSMAQQVALASVAIFRFMKVMSKPTSSSDGKNSVEESSFVNQVKWIVLLSCMVKYCGHTEYGKVMSNGIQLVRMGRTPGVEIECKMSMPDNPKIYEGAFKQSSVLPPWSSKAQNARVLRVLWPMILQQLGNRYDATRKQIASLAQVVINNSIQSPEIFQNLLDKHEYPSISVRLVEQMRQQMQDSISHEYISEVGQAVWVSQSITELTNAFKDASQVILDSSHDDHNNASDESNVNDISAEENVQHSTRIIETVCSILTGYSLSRCPRMAITIMPYILRLQSHPRPEIATLLQRTRQALGARLSLFFHTPLSAWLASNADSMHAIDSEELLLQQPIHQLLTHIEAVSSSSDNTTRFARIAACEVTASIFFSHSFYLPVAIRSRMSEVIIQRLGDKQKEVQEAASQALGIMCISIPVDDQAWLCSRFVKHLSAKLPSKPVSAEYDSATAFSKAKSRFALGIRKRYAGCLGLIAVAAAHPFDVPSFLPEYLALLASRAVDPDPVGKAVRDAVTSFKESHRDEWLSKHSLKFTPEQLQMVNDVGAHLSYFA